MARVYDVSFEDGILRLWRDRPDFAQRYHVRLNAGGMTIQGAWEICEDGQTWRRDFELTYHKVV